MVGDETSSFKCSSHSACHKAQVADDRGNLGTVSKIETSLGVGGQNQVKCLFKNGKGAGGVAAQSNPLNLSSPSDEGQENEPRPPS